MGITGMESLAGHHRPITPINQTKHTEMTAIFVDTASVNEKKSDLWRFRRKLSILKLPQMAPRIIT